MLTESNFARKGLPSSGKLDACFPGTLKLLCMRGLACFIDAFVIAVLTLITVLFMEVSCFHHRLDWGADLSKYALLLGFVLFDAITGSGLLLAPLFVYLGRFCSAEYVLFPLTAIGINYAYHVVFECAEGAATPGKSLLGLKLKLLKEGQPELGRLTIRHALKFLTPLFSLVPLICMLTCNRRQLMHDKLTLTLVEPVRKSINVPQDSFADQTRSDQSQLPVQPASIVRRIVAAALDGLVFYVGELLLIAGVVLLVAHVFPLLGDAPAQIVIPSIVILLLVVCVASTVIMTLAFATFETSGLQATPGKIVAGIKVVGLDGKGLIFSQAFEKQLAQGLAYMSVQNFLWVLVLLAAVLQLPLPKVNFTVAWYVLSYTIYGVMICVTLSRGQTLIDRLSSRMVILDDPKTTISQRLLLGVKHKL